MLGTGTGSEDLVAPVPVRTVGQLPPFLATALDRCTTNNNKQQAPSSSSSAFPSASSSPAVEADSTAALAAAALDALARVRLDDHEHTLSLNDLSCAEPAVAGLLLDPESLSGYQHHQPQQQQQHQQLYQYPPQHQHQHQHQHQTAKREATSRNQRSEHAKAPSPCSPSSRASQDALEEFFAIFNCVRAPPSPIARVRRLIPRRERNRSDSNGQTYLTPHQHVQHHHPYGAYRSRSLSTATASSIESMSAGVSPAASSGGGGSGGVERNSLRRPSRRKSVPFPMQSDDDFHHLDLSRTTSNDSISSSGRSSDWSLVSPPALESPTSPAEGMNTYNPSILFASPLVSPFPPGFQPDLQTTPE